MKEQWTGRQWMEHCTLCPRDCGVNRLAGQRGRCRMDARVMVARAALHMWEEPCISGAEGSGAVFFAGCALGCVYCQNYEIAHGMDDRKKRTPGQGKEQADAGYGVEVSIARLAEIFLELQEKGANNINLVTAGHYVPQTAEALSLARAEGLRIPVVYNSSGYEKAETIAMLEGLVDIYLPDFKYMEAETAEAYSHAADYPETAKRAIAEMVRQTGAAHFDARGILQRGVIVRHLLLPGHVREAKQIVRYLYETYGDGIYISMMNQYTPMERMNAHPLLGRRVKKREYESLLEYAIALGVENGFFQEGRTAQESFIPAFDGEGV